MPVGLRPPWVKISKRPGAGFLGVDGHDNALAAEFLRRFPDELAVAHGGGIDRDLVGAGQQELADVFGLAHAAAHGERHEALRGGAPHHIEHGAAIFVGGGDIEEAQFIGARRVIGLGGFNGIAGIAQVDEVHALHHAAILHVEAGNDAGFQHYAASRMSLSAAFGIKPAIINGAARDGAFENGAIGLQQALHILDGGKAAGGDDRNVHAVGEFEGLFEIDALENAVAVNVGEDDGG